MCMEIFLTGKDCYKIGKSFIEEELPFGRTHGYHPSGPLCLFSRMVVVYNLFRHFYLHHDRSRLAHPKASASPVMPDVPALAVEVFGLKGEDLADLGASEARLYANFKPVTCER